MIEKSLKLALIYSIVAIIPFIAFALILGGNFSAIDIKMYYQYSVGFTHGYIPSINTDIEYPIVAFAYMFVAYIISLGDPTLYLPVHMLLMFSCLIGTLIVTYFLSLKMFKDERRAFITGLLCAASPAVVYFTLLRYDALPLFITMLSIYFFVSRKETPSYILAGIGTVTKFFSLVAVPFYIIHTRSKKILWYIGTIALFTVPFAIINFQKFIYPYVYNFGRPAQAESLFYLLDTITGTTIFGRVGSYIFIIAFVALIYSYYKSENKDMHTLVGYITIAISLTIIFNRVASPQYFLWVTPLLALYFSRNIKTILCFIAFQAITYIQFPLLVQVLFDPTRYYDVPLAIMFFSVKYIIWAIVLFLLWREIKK